MENADHDLRHQVATDASRRVVCRGCVATCQRALVEGRLREKPILKALSFGS